MKKQKFNQRVKEEFKRFSLLKKLRSSKPRQKILETFLELKGHISAEILWQKVKIKDPSIGFATVYRTLKLLRESGIAQEVKISKNKSIFEHREEHHDHLVCERCGKIIEAVDPSIEKLQNDLALKHNFKIFSHSLVLIGLCSSCQNVEVNKR